MADTLMIVPTITVCPAPGGVWFSFLFLHFQFFRGRGLRGDAPCVIIPTVTLRHYTAGEPDAWGLYLARGWRLNLEWLDWAVFE